MADKSEEATPRRLRKAREEGDSGVSSQAAQAAAFLVAVAIAPAAIGALVAQSSDMIRSAIAHASERAPAANPTSLATPILMLVVPILLAAGATSAAVQLVQTGGFFASKKLTPKLKHLNVFEGFKHLFSPTRAFAILRALSAGAIVAYLSFHGLREHAADVAHVAGRLGFVGLLAGTIAHHAVRDAALFGLAVGALDIVITRRAWAKRLRMSKDEVKRETKESEGDPEVKAARARANEEMVSSATIADVKNATIVIANLTRLACALRYDAEEDEAPFVVAVGDGDLARRIVEAAHAFGVPVFEDDTLARALIELAPGDAIPEALYESVAEILRER